jgi:hypothetical protein
MPRHEVIEASLAEPRRADPARDLDEACAIANRIAPEHLELSVPIRSAGSRIRHAGAIFLGRYYSRGARRLLRRPEPRAADRAHGALLLAARGLRFPEAHQPDPPVARGRAHARVDRGETGARRGPAGARQRPSTGSGPSDEARAGRPGARGDPRAQGLHVASAAGLIKLDAMENPYRLPPELQRELGERLARVAINRYPAGRPAALKERLRAASAARRHGLLLGNGSDELIDLLAMACARAGRDDARAASRFVMYGCRALHGLRFVGVPLTPTSARRGDDARGDRRAPPALTFIAYPNNPTGNLFDERGRAHRRRRAGAGGARRGLPAVRARTWMPRWRASATCW